VTVERWVEEALELAVRGRGDVEPNPRVGALALCGERVVGRGWHRVWGGPHAEIEALADAHRAGERPDTLVVTLEPCSSAPGEGGKKTPPCTDAIVAAGIRRVVVGAIDPDPRHRGRAIAILDESGIAVEDGVLADRCRAVNRPFERWLALDRPWTIAKWAMTLDGKAAAPTGEARWVSGLESRRKVHELRARVDAVVVGLRTAQIDDPELTVRYVDGPQPVRIVVDPVGELDDGKKLIRTARELPFWMLVRENIEPARAAHLESMGVVVIPVIAAERGRRLHLLEAWRELRRRGMRRVLVEGGGGLCAELLSWDCIDQVLAFVAPKVIGGRVAPTPVGGEGRQFMAEAWSLDELHWRPSGEDLAIGAFVL
jgi:diaminohydroxyphosphoribosylaminopyrimidine deaminase/5-amino-6-(5-phosphoribosylamino)uracil reductase